MRYLVLLITFFALLLTACQSTEQSANTFPRYTSTQVVNLAKGRLPPGQTAQAEYKAEYAEKGAWVVTKISGARWERWLFWEQTGTFEYYDSNNQPEGTLKSTPSVPSYSPPAYQQQPSPTPYYDYYESNRQEYQRQLAEAQRQAEERQRQQYENLALQYETKAFVIETQIAAVKREYDSKTYDYSDPNWGQQALLDNITKEIEIARLQKEADEYRRQAQYYRSLAR
jgi:hypothetical protein